MSRLFTIMILQKNKTKTSNPKIKHNLIGNMPFTNAKIEMSNLYLIARRCFVKPGGRRNMNLSKVR